MKPLSELDLPWKLLISMFLIVLSSGFLAAELYLKHTTEMADGKEGLSMDDITITFHGNGVPILKRKIGVGGSMRRYFDINGAAEDLKPEDIKDIERVVAWIDRGAPEADYKIDDEKRKNEGIGNIIEKHGCTDCHSRDSTMRHKMPDYPLESFADVSKFTQAASAGMDKGRLLSLSHIHLLGMGMMFMLLGMAIASTQWPVWMRAGLIVGGHLSILLDILGWWGVREFGASMSPVVMAGGALMAVCFLGSVAGSFYDLWIRKVRHSSHGS